MSNDPTLLAQQTDIMSGVAVATSVLHDRKSDFEDKYSKLWERCVLALWLWYAGFHCVPAGARAVACALLLNVLHCLCPIDCSDQAAVQRRYTGSSQARPLVQIEADIKKLMGTMAEIRSETNAPEVRDFIRVDFSLLREALLEHCNQWRRLVTRLLNDNARRELEEVYTIMTEVRRTRRLRYSCVVHRGLSWKRACRLACSVTFLGACAGHARAGVAAGQLGGAVTQPPAREAAAA